MAMRAPGTRVARRTLLLRGVRPVTMNDYAPVLAEYRAVAPRMAEFGPVREIPP